MKFREFLLATSLTLILSIAIPTMVIRGAMSKETSLLSISYSGHKINSMNSTKIMIGGAILIVELAETAAEQQNGLSERTSLDSNVGMLFVFDHSSYWSFWMNDMKFPLDIIWFNSTRQVIFSEPNLQPCTPQNCPTIVPISKAMYVLEVNAGFMVSHHIRLGTSFVFLDH